MKNINNSTRNQTTSKKRKIPLEFGIYFYGYLGERKKTKYEPRLNKYPYPFV